MWDDLLRVDWDRLHHAYGPASGVPKILCDMISADPKTREEGWQLFDDALNHQGNCYNSTRAALPFLVEAVGNPEVPERARLLEYFRKRWLEAPIQGGDLPMSTEEEPAVALPGRALSRGQREDLCAWQVGRAIAAGRSTYERLADDPDRALAAAAAELLLLSPETRARGKRALIRAIEEELDPIEQTRRILEYGVYGESADAATYERWIDPGRPEEVRAASALAWASMMDPERPPGPAARVLYDASADDSEILVRLPSEGIWRRGGLWSLPSNICGLILRLTQNHNDTLRWRAVQGLGLKLGREVVQHLPDERVVPILIERLSDPDDRVRTAASLALSQRGASVFAIDPGVIPALIHALDDEDSSVCGHSARLLAALSDRLSPTHRAGALAGVERAARRFAGRTDCYVRFDSMSILAGRFLERQINPIRRPPDWSVLELFAEIAFPRKQDRRLPLIECDRRLADAYAEDPARLIAAAIEAVRDADERDVSIGAADWLATLGPPAATALPALEVMSGRDGDRYVSSYSRDSIAFIRRSMELASEPIETGPPIGIEALDQPDPIVRARAARRIALTTADAPGIFQAIPALLRWLDDEASVEVGIAGRFEFRGLIDPGPRLHHWHQKRWSPRAEAIRALVHLGRVPEGDRMLRALVAESRQTEIVCARRSSAPHRFGIEIWRAAVDAGGGISAARSTIRAAWSGAEVACKTELDQVLRRLEARLGGGR